MIGVALRQIWRGLLGLGQNPWAQALTLAAVTLSAFLGGLFLLVLFNLDLQLARAGGDFAFQVYWRADADMAEVKKQWSELDTLPRLAGKTTWSPAQALEELAQTMDDPKGEKNGGQGDDAALDQRILAGLKSDNPLPPTALLTFDAPARDPDQWAKGMLAHLESLKDVTSVRFNALELDFARSWGRFSRRVIWPLIGFLGLVVALVVGNTIKLSLLTRREEVEILHLVGASRWYIQLPLLAGGAVQGLVGSVLALCMLKGVQLSLQDLFNTPPLLLEIRFIPLEQAAVVAAVMVLVSVAASWVAVRQ